MSDTPLLQAVHADTPPEVLCLLASDADAAVRNAARANPKCPSNAVTLLDFADASPDKLNAEQLEWLSYQGPHAVSIVLKHPSTPRAALVRLILAGHIKAVLARPGERKWKWLLEEARQRPELLKYLAGSGSGIPWLLRFQANALSLGSVTSGPDQDAATAVPAPTPELVRARLLLRREDPNLTEPELALIQETPRLHKLAARHPLLPINLLEWLDEQQPYGEARETLLRRLEQGALDEETLLRFAWKGDWETRAAVARNPELPLRARAHLAQDDDWWVRAAVAENPNAQPAELTALAAEQGHVTIREHVAAHVHTPGQVLLRLARDGDPAVRAQVARNPSTPPQALALLASDERFGTREAVAAHPLCDPATLEHLARDDNERVRLVANLRLRRVGDSDAVNALDTRRRNVKLALTSQPDLSATLLERLASDRSPLIRAQIGLHPSITNATLDKLMTDPELSVRRVALALHQEGADTLASLPKLDIRVRQALSRNAQAPALLLQELSDDPLPQVRLSVMLNPAAPEGALERRLPEQPLRPIIRRHPRYGQVQEKLHSLEYGEASDQHATPETLHALSVSDSPRVRRRVAKHPNTGEATLTRLTQDAEEDVRLTLSARPADTLSAELQAVLAQDASLAVRLALTARPDLPANVMRLLAEKPSQDEELLLRLSRHPHASPELLGLLARHTLLGVRCAAAGHPLTPIAHLLTLSQDAHEEVKRALLGRTDCPPAVLQRLAEQPNLRLLVTSHSGTDGAILERLACDSGYARLLQSQRWLSKMPWRDAAPVTRWLTWSKGRSSARAFGELALLKAVIVHPAATPLALMHARRLSHPEINAAFEQRYKADKQASKAEPD